MMHYCEHLQDFLLRREPRTTDPGCAQQRACRQRIPRTVRYHDPIRSPKSVPDTVSAVFRFDEDQGGDILQ